MLVYAAPLWGNVLGRLNHWRQHAMEWSISIFVYACRYEHQQTILKEELAKVAQRESEEMTKARTRERLQTRLEAEKTKKLVCTHTHTSLLSIPESSSFLQRQVPSQSPSEGQRVHFWGKIPVTLNIDNINRYIYMETKVKRMTFALASSNKDRRHQKSAAQLSAPVWHLVCVSLIIVPNLQQIHRKWR